MEILPGNGKNKHKPSLGHMDDHFIINLSI